MVDLKTATDEEIQTELAQRAYDKKRLGKPEPIDYDCTNLIDYINYGIQSIHEGKGTPKDFEHYIFESAIETFYGGDIWEWYNKNCERTI
jgi:hypothetical protein